MIIAFGWGAKGIAKCLIGKFLIVVKVRVFRRWLK
jgi:hypothetical protein